MTGFEHTCQKKSWTLSGTLLLGRSSPGLGGARFPAAGCCRSAQKVPLNKYSDKPLLLVIEVLLEDGYQKTRIANRTGQAGGSCFTYNFGLDSRMLQGCSARHCKISLSDLFLTLLVSRVQGLMDHTGISALLQIHMDEESLVKASRACRSISFVETSQKVFSPGRGS